MWHSLLSIKTTHWVICSVVHIVCYGFFYVKSVPTQAWLDYTFSHSFQVTVFQQFLGCFMILLSCCSSSLFNKKRPFNTINQTYQFLLSTRHNVCWCYNTLWVQYTMHSEHLTCLAIKFRNFELCTFQNCNTLTLTVCWLLQLGFESGVLILILASA